MHKVLMVIRREYLDRVRKKSFWIGMALFPVLMVAMIGGQILLAQVGSNKQQRLAVADATGKLFEAIQANLAKYTIKNGLPEYVLERIAADGGTEAVAAAAERRILAGTIDAVVSIGADVDAKDAFRYFSRNVGRPEARALLDRYGVKYAPATTWLDPAVNLPVYRQYRVLLVSRENYRRADMPWEPGLDPHLEEVWAHQDNGRTIAALYRIR